jgi:hypothetical protein
MSTLKETLARKIEEHRPRTVRLLKEYGDVKLSDVTIAQAIGGARGVRCLVTDTSYLDPMEGIRFRGKTIPETFEALPNYPGARDAARHAPDDDVLGGHPLHAARVGLWQKVPGGDQQDGVLGSDVRGFL